MAGRAWKRGKFYHISFSYRGQEYRKSALTTSKRKAEDVLNYYLGLCATGQFKGFGSSEVYTLYACLADFLESYQTMRSVESRTLHVKHLKKFFADMPVRDLTTHEIDRYIKHRKQVVSETTVNRETQTLGQALRLARRKEYIERVPYIQRFSEKDNARQGYFTPEEFARLLDLLPAYLQDVVRFAYCVGWRRSEVLTLEWSDIQTDSIFLPPERDKSKEGRHVPLVGDLLVLIQERERQRVEDCPFVFHREGKPIRDLKRAWKTARRKAGLSHKLFHDFRRTVARNLDRAGVPRQVAKRIIGHKSDEMYNRYRIVNDQDVREGLAQYFAHQTHGVNSGSPKES